MGERRGRGKSSNMNRGLMGMDIGGQTGSRGGRVRENNGEKCGTTVTEQQFKKTYIHGLDCSNHLTVCVCTYLYTHMHAYMCIHIVR